jgi:hypothetical protein
MIRDDLIEQLNLQIVKVQEQLGSQMARGEKPDRTAGLLRSLQLTLRAISAGVDPEDEVASSFLLSASREGQVILRRDGHLVALTGPFVRSLFRLAGVSLEPGQLLLIEPELAKWAIEDSLGATLAEEFWLETRRCQLRMLLRDSADHRRDQLLGALGQLDERQVDLRVAKVELSELNLAAERLLSDKAPAGGTP